MDRSAVGSIIDRIGGDIGFRALAALHFAASMALLVVLAGYVAWIVIGNIDLAEAGAALAQLVDTRKDRLVAGALDLALVVVLVLIWRQLPTAWRGEPIVEGGVERVERLGRGWMSFHGRGLLIMTALCAMLAAGVTLAIGMDGNFAGTGPGLPARLAAGIFVAAFVPGSLVLALLTTMGRLLGFSSPHAGATAMPEPDEDEGADRGHF